MTNYTDFFPVGTGGGGVCPSFFFKTGCSGWTPTKDGCAVIHIIGGGAGTDASALCGGGAGGYIRYAAEFSTADSAYCIVVGAGGHYTGACSMMCGGSPAWCMISYGGCCNVGGGTSYSTTPNGTNMTYAQGGCAFNSGGAVGIFASPGGRGYDGTSGATWGAGGAGVGGQGSVGQQCCCCRNVTGSGGGSGGPGPSATRFYDAYGADPIQWSQPGPALLMTPVEHHKYFKFVPSWGMGGAQAGTAGETAGCCAKVGFNVVPGWGGGGAGGYGCVGPAQRGGPFGGGGHGRGGAYGGYPGGGGGGGVTCSARCYCVCGGDGAVIVEYIEV